MVSEFWNFQHIALSFLPALFLKFFGMKVLWWLWKPSINFKNHVLSFLCIICKHDGHFSQIRLERNEAARLVAYTFHINLQCSLWRVCMSTNEYICPQQTYVRGKVLFEPKGYKAVLEGIDVQIKILICTWATLTSSSIQTNKQTQGLLWLVRVALYCHLFIWAAILIELQNDWQHYQRISDLDSRSNTTMD